jgi:hypothetical protein
MTDKRDIFSILSSPFGYSQSRYHNIGREVMYLEMERTNHLVGPDG